MDPIEKYLRREKKKNNNYAAVTIHSIAEILDESALYYTLADYHERYSSQPEEFAELKEFSNILLSRYTLTSLKQEADLTIWKLACLEANPAMIKLLINYPNTGADVNVRISTEQLTELTPLMCVVNKGSYAATEILLDAGAQVELTGENNFSALTSYFIVDSNAISILQLLVEQPNLRQIINLKSAVQGYTPLMIAITNNDLPAVKLLLATQLINMTIKTNPMGDDLDCFDAFELAGVCGCCSEIRDLLFPFSSLYKNVMDDAQAMLLEAGINLVLAPEASLPASSAGSVRASSVAETTGVRSVLNALARDRRGSGDVASPAAPTSVYLLPPGADRATVIREVKLSSCVATIQRAWRKHAWFKQAKLNDAKVPPNVPKLDIN